MTDMDPRALRDAFGDYLTGVTVVTSVDAEGAPVGFTANSFASVSLNPPLLLVCPGRFLSSFDVFETCSRFAVSILAEGQEDVSNVFAHEKGDRFSKVAVTPDAHGIALIDGAAAYFSCKASKVVQAGDHIILVGEVDAFERSKSRGLGYAGGQYFSLGLERAAGLVREAAQNSYAGTIVRHKDAILLVDSSDGLAPPEVRLKEGVSAMDTLNDHWQKSGLDVDMDQAYSIFDDRETGGHHTYFLAHATDDFTAGLGEYVLISDLSDVRFASPALETMFARYALEVQSSSFGLYVGHEASGEVHHFQKGR